MVPEEKVIEVVVKPGMEEGEAIVFEGESDQEVIFLFSFNIQPGTMPGDIIVVLTMKEENNNWIRKGNDLIYEHTISLHESLLGFEFLLTHLDGRVLRVTSEKNVITKPGDITIIEREGMPWASNSTQRGNLYIKMNIYFPEELSTSQKEVRFYRLFIVQSLAKILPRGAPVKPSGEVKDATAFRVDLETGRPLKRRKSDHKIPLRGSKVPTTSTADLGKEQQNGQKWYQKLFH